MGKVVELKVAEWLEEQGWKVKNLEAWKANTPDISVECAADKSCTVEVKYIGQEDDDFRALLDSLEGNGQAQAICPYKACNYALFRIYEAAIQLEKVSGVKRIAVLVVDALAWPLLETPLKGNWMGQWGYNLCRNESVENDCKWKAFYLSQKRKKKYNNIDAEMPKVIKSLSQIHVMTIEGWELSQQTIIQCG